MGVQQGSLSGLYNGQVVMRGEFQVLTDSDAWRAGRSDRQTDMDGSCIAAVFWLCVCLSLQHRASGETVLRSVKAGANITLHCDLKNIQMVIWYQRCFISNHSVTEFSLFVFDWRKRHKVSGIELEVNHSTASIDLKILNFSDWNLGLYYCATKTRDKDGKDNHLRGNITTKLVYADSMSSPSPSPTPLPGCDQCCPLLLIVCPVTALLAALLSAACVYCCCHREGSREPTVQLKKERARRTDQVFIHTHTH
ncbi:hypothetical protein AAFF_G00342410, partial [Aldrovandia affinis]